MDQITPPKSWMAESILVTILCCLPFGIVGIVYASKINSLFAAGQYEAAEQASANAGKRTKIGFFVGIAYWVVMAIIYGGAIMAMM